MVIMVPYEMHQKRRDDYFMVLGAEERMIERDRDTGLFVRNFFPHFGRSNLDDDIDEEIKLFDGVKEREKGVLIDI